jgi:hypothetical protein
MDHHLIKQVGAWSTLFLFCRDVDRDRSSVVDAAKAKGVKVGEVLLVRICVRTDLNKCDKEKHAGKQPTMIPFSH